MLLTTEYWHLCQVDPKQGLLRVLQVLHDKILGEKWVVSIYLFCSHFCLFSYIGVY